MLFCWSQADRANRVFMGAFSEDQHMQAIADQTQGDKPGLSVIEAIILALNRGVPIEPLRSLQGHAMHKEDQTAKHG